MRLRPYLAEKDYQYISVWAKDERTHALWCANWFPYPLTEEAVNYVLDREAREWNSGAYAAIGDDDKPIGFFVCSVNASDNSAFLKFVILDNELRGKGYGKQMMELAVQYAIDIKGVSAVHLNVFDINERARKCYSRVGFTEESIEQGVFSYKDERWGRCHMVYCAG